MELHAYDGQQMGLVLCLTCIIIMIIIIIISSKGWPPSHW